MWRKPTEDDIVATLSQAEVEAYKTSANWASDPVALLCDRIAAYVRGYLATNGNIRMSPNEHEIPEATISPAMDYLAVDILKRLDITVSEDRRNARRDAIAYFDKIASGRVTVESYGQGDDAQTGGPAVEIVTSSRIRTDASRLEGL